MGRVYISLPVLMKEMRSRMRGLRAPVLLLITTGITIAVALLIIMLSWSDMDGSGADDMAEVGKTLFIAMVVCQGIICALIAPALTAGCISIEKEQQTLEGLFLTRLSCRNIVLGKLFSSLGFLLLVLLCALPVMSLSFLLGGVALADLGWSFAIILATVALFGAIGVYCSARCGKTAAAVTLAYVCCLLALGIVGLVIGIHETAFPSWSDTPDPLSTGYLIYAIAGSAVLALIPTGVLSLLTALPLRRPLPRLANILLWLAIAAAAVYVQVVYVQEVQDFISSDSSVWLLTGNPIMAFFELFAVAFTDFPDTIMQYFVPISVGAMLLCATLITGQAVRVLAKLRNNPASGKRIGKQRGKRARRQIEPEPPETVAVG